MGYFMSKRRVIDSGFVYIWFDRKHKRFYIGSHWGYPSDSYICSSTWMRDAYKRRPSDFKRRIIETINTSRKDLYEAEYKWLSLIKDGELGTRYYNLRKWRYSSIEYTKEIIEKLAMVNRNKTPSAETIAKRSKSLKETYSKPEKKLQQSIQMKDYWSQCGVKEKHSDTMKSQWANTEKRDARIAGLIEAANRPEVKEKISITTKKRWKNPEYRQNYVDKKTGMKMPERSTEYLEKQSITQKELWSSEVYKKKMSDVHLNSGVAMESSRKNIKNCHTPEAIQRSKDVKSANREARKSDPVYQLQMKEQARQRALKRWHPELFINNV
jgi:hypothetical protein